MKPLFRMIAASTVFGAIAMAAFPRDVGKIVSSTRAFSLGGLRYTVGKPAEGDSILREKLGSMGIDISRYVSETENTIGCTIDTLTENPAKPSDGPAPVLSCFREERILRTESGGGSMDISFGKYSLPGGDVAKTLAREGWKIAGTQNSGGPFRFAVIRNKRERSIVLLEEKEGRYLSIRQLEK